MSGASKKLHSKAKALMPSGVNSPVRHYDPYPFFAARANGGTIWDEDGEKYVDMCCAYGALFLGHRRQEIVRAVSSQLARGTLYCTPTRTEVELCGQIVQAYPSMSKVRLVNTGAEATMTAIRLARAHTGGKKIVKFEGCYHGAHDSVLVRAGSGSAHAGISTSEGDLKSSTRNTLVVQYNNTEQMLDVMERNRNDLAGVIVEPVLANMGLILPENGFLRKMQSSCRQHGVPLIFDETVTGFRMGSGGAQEYFGIKPDITTLGKALGGGFAIAAVGGKKRIMEQLAPSGRVYQASTFAGNPVSTAASLAAVKIMRKSRRMYSDIERRCSLLVSAIDDAANELNIAHQINYAASMFQIFFTDRPVTDYTTCKRADTVKFNRLFRGLLKSGVFVAPSQFEVAFLSTAHTKSDISHAAHAYADSLREVKNA